MIFAGDEFYSDDVTSGIFDGPGWDDEDDEWDDEDEDGGDEDDEWGD